MKKTNGMSLKEFMKKYSPIPNAFINDLFSLYGPSTQQSDHVVDVDAAAKWLKVRKDNLLSTLRESYTKDVDYIVRTAPMTRHTPMPGNWGGQNRVQVLLTPDCFKRLCMRSRGKKAEEVRTYFIQVEGLVMKYKDHMLAGMQAEIDRLEMSSGRLHRPGPTNKAGGGGYLYVLRASERLTDAFKIGRTVNVRRRLREHEASRADDVEVMFLFRTNDIETVESCVKATLKRTQIRPHREVYQLDLDTLKAIIHGCDELRGLLKLEHKAAGPGKLTGGCFLCAVRDGDE